MPGCDADPPTQVLSWGFAEESCPYWFRVELQGSEVKGLDLSYNLNSLKGDIWGTK